MRVHFTMRWQAFIYANVRFVAMVGADEATCCQEVGLPYAAVCMVDNMANGLQTLTYTNFKDAVKANADTVVAMARALLAELPAAF